MSKQKLTYFLHAKNIQQHGLTTQSDHVKASVMTITSSSKYHPATNWYNHSAIIVQM